MSTSRKLFDVNVMKMKHQRAKKLGSVDFIDIFVINHALEILSDINREFNVSAVIGKKAEFWARGLKLEKATLLKSSDTLDFKNETFDLIIHAFSLHCCNDPVGQLIQVRKALKPDGLMLAFCFGGESLRELRDSFETAEIMIENGISPRVSPMIKIKDAGDLLVRAGFSLSVADKTDLEINYKLPINLIYDLRGMGETNSMVNREKKFLKRIIYEKFLEIYAKKYKVEDGNKVKATFQVLCLTGWAPAPTQQKPLKPGSATHHFSTVLNTYKL